MRFDTKRTGPAAAPASANIPPGAQLHPAALALGFAGEAQWLGAGLRADGLHEIHAAPCTQAGSKGADGAFAATSFADTGAALGFALLLAEQQRRQAGASGLIWVREQGVPGVPYGPGLAELGCDPSAITLLRLPDGKAVLRAGLDALRSGAATVLIELHGRQPLLDLTATRRLALAAGQTGTLALVLRCGAAPAASAAHSRWLVHAAPCVAMAENAPGRPAFALTLLRQRGGRDGLHIIVEWNRDHAAFEERRLADSPANRPPAAPLFGAVFAMATSRTGAARRAGGG